MTITESEREREKLMYYEALNFVEERCTVCHTVWLVAEGHYNKPYICPSCKEEQMEDKNGR